MSAAAKASYLDVLGLPGALRAFAPSVLGKLSFAMVSLALLLLVQGASGSYGLAGAVAGGFGLGNVVVSSLRARMVDYYGARRVLPWLAVGYSTALIGVIIAVVDSAPGGVTVSLAVLAGLFPPPLGAVMRGMWARLSPTEVIRRRAYSLDAVAEELVFIVGPLLVGAMMLLPNGALIAVLIAAVAGLLGTLGLATAALPGPHAPGQRASGPTAWAGPLRHLRLWPVLLTLVAIGVVLGALEVLSTAHARAIADIGLAGALLACSALGSAAGGLMYGVRTWPWSLVPRLLVLAGVACAVLTTAAWASHPVVLFVLFALAGLLIAPSMITGYLAADEIAAAHERTEASALINTAVNSGATAALFLGGIWLDGMTIAEATILLAAVTAACVTAGLSITVLTRSGSNPTTTGR